MAPQSYNITTDVSKKSQVEAMFDELKKQCAPSVRGVFHLAGYTDNSTSTSEEDLRHGINAQANGAENLSQVSTEHKLDLDHFVLFSSAVSAWGHPGFSNLCAVAQHLDAVAVSRKFSGQTALCVLLGNMRGTGSLTEDEDVVYAMEKSGMSSLHVNEYLDILGSLLSKGAHLPPTVAITNQVRFVIISLILFSFLSYLFLLQYVDYNEVLTYMYIQRKFVYFNRTGLRPPNLALRAQLASVTLYRQPPSLAVVVVSLNVLLSHTFNCGIGLYMWGL